MISCAHCHTDNGLDSKFCKSCGQPLPEESIKEAVDKHEKMIREGYALFNSGRTGEAQMIAQAAVEQDGTSANAYSLLGMCLERNGQLAEALECFERVLMICPDSALDRMKVTQLRATLTNSVKIHSSRKSRFAVLAAIGAMVVVAGMGVILLNATPRAVAANVPSTTAASQADAQKPFVSPAQQAMNAPQSTGQPPKQQAAPDPVQVATDALAKAVARERTPSTPDSNETKPDDPSTKDVPVAPVFPAVPSGTDMTSAKADIPNTVKSDAQATDPTPVPDGSKAPQAKDPEPPKEDPGVIEISVSHAHGDSGQASGGSPNQLQALLKAAKNQFLVGRYDSAAKTYEKALAAGGDPATINQRLGMCYSRLGRTSEAVAAYTRAAGAFESELNSGQGDAQRLKAGRDACRQAIMVLKG